jgi:hypothetical protein
MLKKTLIALMILALSISACSAAAPRQESAPGRGASEAEAPVAPVEEVSSDNSVYGGQVPQARRLVITNATISLSVEDPVQSMERIASMAEEMGGFVVTSRMSQVTLESGLEVPQVAMTVRVPAERLDEALERIRQETDRPVLSENTDSQDVTKEYTDLESRLRNLEAAEAQLQRIMEDADETEDVLQVYNELKSVREQIEVIKGQMQYYEQSAALSAISIDLMANEAAEPLSIGGWQPVGVARDALQALINGVKVLANIGIWMVLFVLPILFLIGFPIYLLIRLLRRGIKPKPKPPAPVKP